MRRQRRPRTDEDDARLTELVATCSDVDVGKIMDRSVGLIGMRRKRLGLPPCRRKVTVPVDTGALQVLLSRGWPADPVDHLSRWT